VTADLLVIDASAALGVLLKEDGEEPVKRTLNRWRRKGGRIVVPELFWVEITNSLTGKHRQPFDVVLEAIATLDGMGLSTVQTGRTGVLAMVDAVIGHGLTAYDAVYLALAETLDARLLTLDRELATAAGARAVSLPDLGLVGEERAVYRLEPWITWDEAADYFAAAHRATELEAAGR
jgi:predicted nucleic acid-binding protein